MLYGVPFYLCMYPLSQNYQIWRGRPNSYGKGACFKGSATSPPEGSGVPVLPIFGVPFYLGDDLERSQIYGSQALAMI